MPGGHDQLFKDLIRSFPAEFLSLTAPDVLPGLDPASLEFQPAEIHIDLPRGAQRHLDLVARARTRSGEPPAVLLNVEIELRFRAGVPARLWSYNRQLHLRYDLPVHTFVLYLRGGPPGVRTEILVESSLGREILRFQYTSFGLSGAAGEEYIQRPEPLAWALAALMQWPGKDRHAQRRACLDRLTRERHLDDARRFLLFNCISTYLELDGRALEQYQALLAEHSHKENQGMAMTWAEKFEARAVARGMQEILLRLLEQRFAPLPASVTRRVSALTSTEELTRLADQVLSARSLEELGLA